jgi:hypothetical protein
MENSAKPDLKTGFPLDKLPDDGMILGQADGEDVVLARHGDELFAVGAFCTPYGQKTHLRFQKGGVSPTEGS